jgi:hypothetical protein
MSISEQEIKSFLQEKNYITIIFSPQGKEIWYDDNNNSAPPYNCPVQPFQELPHDNFVKLTYYITSSGAFVSGTEKSCIEEIKEGNTDFLTKLFKWAKSRILKG